MARCVGQNISEGLAILLYGGEFCASPRLLMRVALEPLHDLESTQRKTAGVGRSQGGEGTNPFIRNAALDPPSASL
jgi:hypothetical protein